MEQGIRRFFNSLLDPLFREGVIRAFSFRMEASAEFGKGSRRQRLPHGRHQVKVEEEIMDGVEPV